MSPAPPGGSIPPPPRPLSTDKMRCTGRDSALHAYCVQVGTADAGLVAALENIPIGGSFSWGSRFPLQHPHAVQTLPHHVALIPPCPHAPSPFVAPPMPQ